MVYYISVNCGQIPRIADGTVSNNGSVSYGNNLTITCDTGFTTLNQTSRTVTCTQNGTWGNDIQCLPINCLAFSPEAPLYVFNSTDTNNKFRDTLILKCIDGYQVNGYDTIACLANGTWSDAPSCDPKTCAVYVSPENCHIIAEQTMGNYGDTINITCEDGYLFVDETVTTEECTADGNWTSRVTCEPIPCKTYALPTHANLTSGNVSDSVYNDTITLSCEEGFQLSNELAVFCQTNGTWTPSPTCDPKPCADYVSPDNSHSVPDQTVGNYGDTINITCEYGYLFGDGTVTTEECTADGNWTSRVTCEPITCENYTKPVHTVVNSGNLTHSVYNDIIQLSCEAGYKLSDETDITCQSNGSWSIQPSCEKIKCNNYTIVEGSHSSSNGTTGVFMDTLLISCDPGYDHKNVENVTEQCQADGNWTNQVKCVLVSCGDYETPTKAVLLGNASETTYTSTRHVSCNDGYQSDEGSTITVTCQANATWDPVVKCERKSCSSFTSPAYSTANVTGSQFNDTIIITCIHGYMLEGNGSVICQSSGNWTTPGTCNPRECELFSPPENGNSTRTQVKFGESIIVTCDEGLQLIGESSISCLSNGSWPKVYCQKINCSANVTVDDASISYPTASSLKVKCNDGYTLNGNETVFCTGESWGELPSCFIEDCGAYPNVPNGTVAGDGTTYLSNRTINCETGFESPSGSVVNVECNVDGNWSSIVTCTLVDCGEYIPSSDIYSVTRANESTLYGTRLNVSCAEGYNLDGDTFVSCQSDGTWSNSGQCVPVDCEDPAIQNGQSHATNTTLNTTITISCDNGYVMNGSAQVTCQTNGNWSSLPNCIYVSCGNIAVNQSVSRDYLSDNTSYGSLVNVTCEEGYLIDEHASAIFVCTDIGEWNTTANCEARPCDTLELPDKMSLIDPEPSYKFGDSVTVQCNNGSTMFGNPTFSCSPSGSWNSIPKCISCPDFQIMNGTVSVQAGNATVTCDNGFTIDDSSGVVCQENASWTQVPTCNIIDCSMPNEVINGIVELNDNRTTFGARAEVRCNKGYNLTGNPLITCLDTSEWNINGTCDVVAEFCDEYQPPENLVISSSATTFNASIQVNCTIGYKFVNGNTTYVTCGGDGNWEGSPECTKVTCGVLNTTDNSITDYNNTRPYCYNDIVTVTCKDGYIQEGSTSVTCLDTGVWSTSPYCQIVNCTTPTKPLNGGFIDQGEPHYYNKSISVECKDGYNLTGPEEIVCLFNRSWSTLPVCEAVECGNYIPPSDDLVAAVPYNRTYMDTVNVTCKTGFDLKGSPFVKCQSNATWSQSPTCSPVDCGNYSQPENSVVEGTFTTYDSSVLITCTVGFELQGSNTSTCMASGNWSEAGHCVQVDCGNITIPENSVLINELISTVIGSVIAFNCTPGYMFANSNMTTYECKKDGNWSGDPRCALVPCELLEPPVNSTLKNSTTTTYFYQDTVFVECKDGFFQNGSSAITCTNDGSWSSLPSCELLTCPPVYVANSSITLSTPVNVTVTCHDQFDLVGSSIVLCQEDGSWTELPYCNLTRCGEMKLSEGLYRNSSDKHIGVEVPLYCNTGYTQTGSSMAKCLEDGYWNFSTSCTIIDCGGYNQTNHVIANVTSTLYNSTVPMSCVLGYELSTNSSDTVVCGKDGMWIGVVQCDRVPCEALETPNNASIVSGDNTMQSKYGDELILNCNAGFTLNGNEKVTCQANGSWTDIPTCKEITCKPFLNPANATISPIKGVYHVNESVQVDCEDGYTLVGTGNVTCMDNGTWNVIPSCTLSKCNNFTAPANGDVAGDMFNSFYGDYILINCQLGYNLNGSSEVNCLSSGSWSNSPTCDIVKCGDLSAPANGFVSGGSTTFNSSLTVSCNDGYILDRPGSAVCLESGNWSVAGTCNPVDCGDYNTSMHVSQSENSSSTFGSVTMFTCVNGYEFASNDSSIECSENGTWIGNPVCTPIKCELFALPTDASVTNSSSKLEYVFGDKVILTCNNGLTLMGPSEVECLASTEWSTLPTCERSNCSTLDIGNATIVPVTSWNMTVECKDSFTLVGSLNVICMDNGTWSASPVCDVTRCEPFITSLPELTTNTTEDRADTVVGVSCVPGYILNGSSVVTCQLDGSWTPIPSCNIQDCGEYVNNDETLTIEDGPTVYNTSRPASCIDGMVLKAGGDFGLFCNATGTWEGSPECEVEGTFLCMLY